MTAELNITSYLPLISCVMPTFGRPAYVPEAVASFLQQDYPNKELILLNDCPGQTYVGDLPGVRIVNLPERFKTLGDKRNASIEMASGEIIAVWDDDDISLPWRLSWSWEEMQRYKTPFYRSTEFLAYWGEEKLHDNRSVPGWVSHGQVAYTKDLWEKAGRYPSQGVGEDASLFSAFDKLLNADFLTHPIPRSERFYVMRGSSQYQHMSIGGGREPLNLTPGTYSIEPQAIQDETLRTACDQQIDRHGIHSQSALSRSAPYPFDPVISICISLKNRSRMLHEGRLLDNFPRTVRSISDLAEEFGPIELIVADFHSDDWPLSQWLVSAGNLRVKIVPVDGDFSRGLGLNIAARHASCDRLFLTDADILVRPEALKRGLSSLERGVARFPIFRYLDIEGREQGFEDFTRGLTFLTRDLMQRSGGVPEFFSWGGDDDIFYNRLSPLSAVERERDGDLLHQWHSESTRHQHYVRPRKHDYESYVKHPPEAQLAVFKIEHPDWVGDIREIVLWKDGRFERPGIDSGTYVYEPGERLTLNWSRWNPEVLPWDNDRGCYRDAQREIEAWLRVPPRGDGVSQTAIELPACDQSVCSNPARKAHPVDHLGERPIVSCKPLGRLGNNLFQVAAALGFAARHGTHDAVFPKDAFGHYPQTVFRNLTLGEIPLEHTPVGDPADFTFNDKIPASPDRSIVFCGFAQSEKYFSHCKELIRRMFAPPDELVAALYAKYGHLLRGSSASIHVRRGDYLLEQDHHPVQTVEYYVHALAQLSRRVDIDHVLCFSDDPIWCREHLLPKDSRLILIEGQDDYHDLVLMSLCRHHIIANSSFSWWGAWLGQNPAKIVIVPDVHFGPAFVGWSDRDIYPESWARLADFSVPDGVHPHGYWVTQHADEHHAFDTGLCRELTRVFLEEGGTVIDFGCGPGHYVRSFRDAGIRCDGFDGNPRTPEFTEGACGVLDLSRPLKIEHTYDWVLSLEVGEHIPRSAEETFLNNLHRHNSSGIILSWAVEGQGGHGHVNERDNQHIRDHFRNLGYVADVVTERRLRESATNCPWFRNTIMVFRSRCRADG